MAQYPELNNVTFKTIKRGDYDFYMTDGIKVVPRAAIEISALCPANMRLMIERALADGYLKPIAYVKDKDYMWEKLGG